MRLRAPPFDCSQRPLDPFDGHRSHRRDLGLVVQPHGLAQLFRDCPEAQPRSPQLEDFDDDEMIASALLKSRAVGAELEALGNGPARSPRPRVAPRNALVLWPFIQGVPFEKFGASLRGLPSGVALGSSSNAGSCFFLWRC